MPEEPKTARSASLVRPSRIEAASIAASFHTWRFDAPSSYDEISARLGSTMRSRTRPLSSELAASCCSSRSTAMARFSSQIDSMYVLKKSRVGPSTLSRFG